VGEPADQVDERPLFRSRELLQLRIASRRVAPRARPLPNDGWARLLLDSLRSPFQIGPESNGHRVLMAVWCLAMLVAPSRGVRWLLLARYGRRG
jgi:hypothetical protein